MWQTRHWWGQPKPKVRVQNSEGTAFSQLCCLTMWGSKKRSETTRHDETVLLILGQEFKRLILKRMRVLHRPDGVRSAGDGNHSRSPTCPTPRTADWRSSRSTMQFTWLRCHVVTLSCGYVVTWLRGHVVTWLRCHVVTLSRYHVAGLNSSLYAHGQNSTEGRAELCQIRQKVFFPWGRDLEKMKHCL